MKATYGLAALALIAVTGCGKGDDTNSTNSSANQPAVSAANTPDANAVPEANNSPNTATNSNPGSGNATTTPNPTKDKLRKELETDREKKDKQILPIQPASADKGSEGVKKALQLAGAMDASLKNLKDIKLHFSMGAILPEGRGDYNNDTIIADNKRYLINYAKFSTEEFPHFETYVVAKMPNGSYATLVGDKYAPGRVSPEADLLTKWPTDSTHYITSAIGTQSKPFTDLINAANKASWKINVETKKFERGTYQRIIMESKSGPTRRYEIMVEPMKMLPVSFDADIVDKKKTQTSLNILAMKSDRPLTDADLKPKVDTEKINVLTPDEARKKGILVPDAKSNGKDKPNV